MKILAPLLGEQIAPRFDLAVEVLIAEGDEAGLAGEPRIVLLPGPSADELCALILKEGVGMVVCGGIEESHFQYLAWKKVRVIDRVIAPWRQAIGLALAGGLKAGAILRSEPTREEKS
ncbi:MAG: hypothetical protein ACOY3Z_03455 [Thermodesulfobacteriota bacterium]